MREDELEAASKLGCLKQYTFKVIRVSDREGMGAYFVERQHEYYILNHYLRMTQLLS